MAISISRVLSLMGMRGQGSSQVAVSDEQFMLCVMAVQAILGYDEMTTNDATTLGSVFWFVL